MNKRIYKNIAVGALMLISAAFTSCNQDAEGTTYSPDGNACYSFASSMMTSEVTADDNGIVNVPVYRGISSGDVTLTVSAESEHSDVLTLPSEVKFTDGQNVAYAQIGFNIDDLEAGQEYSVSIAIEESKLSPSGTDIITVNISRKLTFELLGTGVWQSQLFGQAWYQPVYKAQEANVYRLPDLFYEGYPIVFSLSEDGNELTGWSIQPIGYDTGTYGMLYFAAAGMVRNGNTLEFPMRGVVEYNGGWGVLYSGFSEFLQLP